MINGWLIQNLDTLSLLAQTTAEPEVTANPLLNLFSLISYLVNAFCFWKIFQRLGETNAWFAWVPFLNLWKTFKAGGKSPWWLLTFIPPITIVGIIFYFMALVNIVKRLGKTPWLVLLTLIPLVNFWVMYHLAFQ